MQCIEILCFQIAKKILCYVIKTKEFKKFYPKINYLQILDYTNTNWVENLEYGKFTIRFKFCLGIALFIWLIKKIIHCSSLFFGGRIYGFIHSYLWINLVRETIARPKTKDYKASTN